MHRRAAALLWAVWRGIPASYKSRYRRSIWRQFEDNIRSAAYTGNLGKFIDSLCLNLAVEFRVGDDIETMNDALREGNDKTMLKLMREETTLLVLIVRLWNQQRRENWEASREGALDMEKQFDEGKENENEDLRF